MAIFPALFLLFDPVPMETEPLSPLLPASAVPIAILPLEVLWPDPDMIDTLPPLAPALSPADITIEPPVEVLRVVASPASMVTDPPEESVTDVLPAEIWTSPPTPDTVLPTTSDILPLAPDRAAPVDREIDPESPVSALPVLMSMSPLAPFLPRSLVSRIIFVPLLTVMSPPLGSACAALVDKVILPGALYTELPVAMSIEPEG